MLGRICLTFTLLTLLAAAPAAGADTVTGGATLALGGSAARPLRFVATDPAAATRRTVELPAYSATFGARARIVHSGVLQVQGGGKRLNLVALRTILGPAPHTTALLGGKRMTLLTYGGRAQVDATAGTAKLTAARATLAPRAARALRTALGLPGLTAGKLGVADVAVARPAPVTDGPVTDPGPGPAAGTTQAITWRPRESFVRYINSEDGSFTAAAPAQNGPPEVRAPSDAALVYSFGFPTGTGTVSARWQSRGIDLQFGDPQVPAGASSMSMVLGGTTSGGFAGQRVALFALDPAKATAHTVDGAAETYANVPAVLTAEGAQAFAGFYAPGDEFGSVTVTTTTH